jgi:hypothetical protein
MIGQVQPAPTPATPPDPAPTEAPEAGAEAAAKDMPREIGGREGPEPTRYGDWEKNGRCIDF